MASSEALQSITPSHMETGLPLPLVSHAAVTLWPPAQHRPLGVASLWFLMPTLSQTVGTKCFFSQNDPGDPRQPCSPHLGPRAHLCRIVDGHLLVVGASHQDIWPVGQAQASCLAPGDTHITELGQGPDRALPTQPPAQVPSPLSAPNLLPVPAAMSPGKLHCAVPGT